MKTGYKKYFAQNRTGICDGGEGGFVATFMFIGLLVIMLMLATAGGVALLHLHNEVRVLEHQQIKLDASVTNSVVITHYSWNTLRVDIK